MGIDRGQGHKQVKVTVLKVDVPRKRIALSMKGKPGGTN